MFLLSDLYTRILNKPLPAGCGICCEILDAEMAKLNRLLTESVSCFSYTLVTAGRQSVDFDDKHVELMRNDLFISTPGMRVLTRDVSDDYKALCLMGDETVTFETPYARNAIAASYFPALAQTSGKLTLTDDEARWLEKRMKEIMTYTGSRHTFRVECLYLLYSLFILDLLNVESRFEKNVEFGGHTADLFCRFLKMLSGNFRLHHDIAYYAGALAVTPIYLSRIVKRFSGQTVKNHIDRLLVMEASYMLTATDMPVSQIATTLNFANQASFCKFFVRHKGVSPREYRVTGPSEWR